MKTEDKIKKTESQEKKVTESSCSPTTCVCNMEWRGARGDEESDCICYPETEKK